MVAHLSLKMSLLTVKLGGLDTGHGATNPLTTAH